MSGSGVATLIYLCTGTSPGMVRLVNVVGSGRTDRFLDIDRLEGAAGEGIDCTRRSDSRLTLRFGEGSPIVTVHRTGKYSIRNATAEAEIEATDERLWDFLSRVEGDDVEPMEPLSIDNQIWIAELDGDVDLEGLADELGENAALPERSGAALVSRFPDRATVAFVTPGGTVTVSGNCSTESVRQTVADLESASA